MDAGEQARESEAMADGYGSLGTSLPGGRMRVRALFLSDLHLGTRDCQAELVLDLLQCCEAELIYLVGDVVDGWRLKARWHWPRSHDDIVRCLLEKQHAGTRILCIPGNHDEFLRHSIGLRLGGIEVMGQAIHQGTDGRRYLVVHGDQFDPALRRMRRLTGLGIWVYAAAVLLHDAVTGWRRRHGRGGARRAARIAAFEHALAAEARRQQMHGVVCGHVHHPAMHDRLGVHYVNTGDWMEFLHRGGRTSGRAPRAAALAGRRAGGNRCGCGGATGHLRGRHATAPTLPAGSGAAPLTPREPIACTRKCSTSWRSTATPHCYRFRSSWARR